MGWEKKKGIPVIEYGSRTSGCAATPYMAEYEHKCGTKADDPRWKERLIADPTSEERSPPPGKLTQSDKQMTVDAWC